MIHEDVTQLILLIKHDTNQIQESKVVASQMTADYRGDFSTTSLTLGNIDLLNQSGIGVLHYLHSVTPTIDAGVEVAYQKGPQVPGGGMAGES